MFALLQASLCANLDTVRIGQKSLDGEKRENVIFKLLANSHDVRCVL